MRAILVFAILVLGLSGAAPEPKYSMRGDDIRAGRDLDGLVAIESSNHRGDRLRLAMQGPRVLHVEVLKPEVSEVSHGPLHLAALNSNFGGTNDENIADTPSDTPSPPPQPTALDNLCNTLFSSAQDNDLPIAFFANLLWQESRLRADDVSKKGAQGIAQFMPKTAVETGLANPFDPMQAIPASARFLQRLRLQFGNLGFVAAAYNAGAHRVIEWLERRASLPRETRDYVVRVTGLSVETWKTMPIDNAALTFVPHLPCRSLPAFANVEQEQMQLSELERAKRPTAADEEAANSKATDQTAVAAAPEKSSHERARETRHLARESQSSRPASKREAKHLAREEHGTAHEAKHGALRLAREERGSTHEAKHYAMHVTREGHASKHEAAHTHGGRERHRSA